MVHVPHAIIRVALAHQSLFVLLVFPLIWFFKVNVFQLVLLTLFNKILQHVLFVLQTVWNAQRVLYVLLAIAEQIFIRELAIQHVLLDYCHIITVVHHA
jgi:hypothetical protein